MLKVITRQSIPETDLLDRNSSKEHSLIVISSLHIQSVKLHWYWVVLVQFFTIPRSGHYEHE